MRLIVILNRTFDFLFGELGTSNKCSFEIQFIDRFSHFSVVFFRLIQFKDYARIKSINCFSLRLTVFCPPLR